VVADAVVIGIGITPTTALAQAAGLQVGNGIAVNEYGQTSHPDLYAAGDVAEFPYTALGETTRLEHWDHAINHGKSAGRNLAGAASPYDYLPYFFSDLFEFGYEAVGNCSPRLETFADWQKENETGVIYYLADHRVRGAMMCNVWDQVPAARELILAGKTVTESDLRGAIS
jgi:NADPH-dependent 2,4-dienoyl-CoA reductase/sulfur reductase-like enzyme